MTLVRRTPSGSLIQTEVGMIDVVNTFSAARSVYGSMGGTEGLRFLLDRIREETVRSQARPTIYISSHFEASF